MLIAALLSLLSLLGLIFTITSGLATSGVDGLFLILVCLLTGTVFGLLALSLAARSGRLPRFGKARK